MQSKRDGLVPIGEVVSDLGGPVQAIRKTPPPAQRAFTRFDQVNQLVRPAKRTSILVSWAAQWRSAPCREATPGNRLQYKRVNGPFTLYMNVVGDNKLPYGNLLACCWPGYAPKRYGPKAAS